ncbi:MAG: MBL fold metallo-hydrolase [Clostridia bacterium]|nr:MBL fold metallo-hydrolase [Clostridia bacterium]
MAVELTWLGTASVALRCGAGKLLFDPFVPIRYSEVPTTVEDFDGYSDIFVTHGHFDHIASIPEILGRNPETTVWCTETPYLTLRRYGVPEKNLKKIAFGDELTVNGFTVRVLHGKHAVLGLGPGRIFKMFCSRERGNLIPLLKMHLKMPEHDETVFFEIEAEGRRIALTGSLNLRDEVTYPTGADLLVLPYNGWKDNRVPAVMALNRLQPKRAVLDHYDVSFPPFTVPLDLAPILAYDKVPVETIGVGETTEV